MNRQSCYAVALSLVFVTSAPLFAEDTDEVAELRRQVTLLQKDNDSLKTKLELAERTLKNVELENEALEKEVADLKPKQPKAAKKTLTDMLPAGAALNGDSTFVGKKLLTGTFSLTIKKREGKKFTGAYSASGGLSVEIEGTVTGERLRFYSINSARKINVVGGRKGEVLYLDFSNEIGDHYALTAKLP